MNENLDNKYSPENAEHTENAENRQYTDPNAGAEQNQYQGNYYYDAGPDPANQQYQQNYQYQQPYQQYQQNYQPGYDPGMDQKPLSMGEWILTILVMMIPCVGLILYLIWAFGKTGNVNRRNYCRAYLIIYVVILAISIAFRGRSIFRRNNLLETKIRTKKETSCIMGEGNESAFYFYHDPECLFFFIITDNYCLC